MSSKIAFFLFAVCAVTVYGKIANNAEDPAAVLLPYYGHDGYPHYYAAPSIQKRSVYDIFNGEADVASGYPIGVPQDPHFRTKRSAFPDVDWGLWSHNCRPCSKFDALNPCCRK